MPALPHTLGPDDLHFRGDFEAGRVPARSAFVAPDLDPIPPA